MSIPRGPGDDLRQARGDAAEDAEAEEGQSGRAIRIGAVGYLNARPLVHGLDRRPGRFSVRFDVPSVCAKLLHANEVDLGLIPSIEYLAGPSYSIVPGIGIISRGAVASVALFTQRPVADIRSIALDSSSRTSAALVRVLCAERFGVQPDFRTLRPDLSAMLRQCDAALLIGDIALFADPDAAGVEKIDLGEEWTSHTGLPFVWAFWAGRPGVLRATDVEALANARDAGVAASDAIAAEYLGAQPEKIAIGQRYLKDNIKFTLAEQERAGLRRYYESAAKLGLAPSGTALRFYEE